MKQGNQGRDQSNQRKVALADTQKIKEKKVEGGG